MPKALGVNVTQKEYRLAKVIWQGIRNFDDLSDENKRILYECPMSLEGLVSEEEVRLYELELAADGEFGKMEKLKALARMKITNGK